MVIKCSIQPVTTCSQDRCVFLYLCLQQSYKSILLHFSPLSLVRTDLEGFFLLYRHQELKIAQQAL